MPSLIVIAVPKPQDSYPLTVNVFYVYTSINRCNQAETTMWYSYYIVSMRQNVFMEDIVQEITKNTEKYHSSVIGILILIQVLIILAAKSIHNSVLIGDQ